VVFGDPWAALGAFGRPLGLHLSPSGVHWHASGASLGSICRLWGSIEAPLGAFGGHWGSRVASLFGVFLTVLTEPFENVGDLLERKSTKLKVQSVRIYRYLLV